MYSSSPIAESTRSDAQRSLFPSMIPTSKRKLTSSKNKSIFRSTSSLHTLSKIDAEVYTDVQSKGLVSRIARYTKESQNEAAKQNRSSSLSNLYTKAGDFPIVHLHKEQIKISKANDVPSSLIKIPPPQKSLFLNQSRSNILKKSFQTPYKLEPQIMRPSNVNQNENEPITPVHEVIEQAPTRSALDDLREVSRKRINNEELDAERIKKQCKEFTETDGPFQSISGNKRAREIHSSNTAVLVNAKSPKRVRHNDIISSLTSGISLSIPKRLCSNFQPTKRQLDEDSSLLLTTECNQTSINLIDTQNIDINLDNHSDQQQECNIEQLDVIHVSDPKVGTKTCQKHAIEPKIRMFNTKYDNEDCSEKTFENLEELESPGDLFIKPRTTPDIEKFGVHKKKKSQLERMLQYVFGVSEESTAEPVLKQTNDVVDNAVSKEELQNKDKDIESSSTSNSNTEKPLILKPSEEGKQISFTKTEEKMNFVENSLDKNPKATIEILAESSKVALPTESSLSIGIENNTSTSDNTDIRTPLISLVDKSKPSENLLIDSQTKFKLSPLPSVICEQEKSKENSACLTKNNITLSSSLNIFATENNKPNIRSGTKFSSDGSFMVNNINPVINTCENSCRPETDTKSQSEQSKHSLPAVQVSASFTFKAPSNIPPAFTFGGKDTKNNSTVNSSKSFFSTTSSFSSENSTTTTSVSNPTINVASPSLNSSSNKSVYTTSIFDQPKPTEKQNTVTTTIFGGSNATVATPSNSIFGGSTAISNQSSSIFGNSMKNPSNNIPPNFGSSSANKTSFETGHAPNDSSIFAAKPVSNVFQNSSNLTVSQSPFSISSTKDEMKPNPFGSFGQFSGFSDRNMSTDKVILDKFSFNNSSSAAVSLANTTHVNPSSTFSFNGTSSNLTALNFGQTNNTFHNTNDPNKQLFSFGTNQAQNPFVNSSSVSQSMFSIGTNGTNSPRTPGTRPIRTATRRLNK